MFEKLKGKLKVQGTEIEGVEEKTKKKRIENIVFLIILLIVTVIIINMVWGEDDGKAKEQGDKVLAEVIEHSADKAEQTNFYYTLQSSLEEILETIEGVGKVKGFNNSIVLANGESINVVIEDDELIQEEIAQIQNIITREMSTAIENIHIMKK